MKKTSANSTQDVKGESPKPWSGQAFEKPSQAWAKPGPSGFYSSLVVHNRMLHDRQLVYLLIAIDWCMWGPSQALAMQRSSFIDSWVLYCASSLRLTMAPLKA